MTTRDIQSTVATSQHTVNYDLPLWDGNDITSWQGNLNDAFNKIDTAMYDNKTEMLGYQEIADELKKTNESSMGVFDTLNERIETAEADIEGLSIRVSNLDAKGTNNAAAINTMRLELDALKAQCDTMQDDVGQLMAWHTGYRWDLTENLAGPDGTYINVVRYLGTRLGVEFHHPGNFTLGARQGTVFNFSAHVEYIKNLLNLADSWDFLSNYSIWTPVSSMPPLMFELQFTSNALTISAINLGDTEFTRANSFRVFPSCEIIQSMG